MSVKLAKYNECPKESAYSLIILRAGLLIFWITFRKLITLSCTENLPDFLWPSFLISRRWGEFTALPRLPWQDKKLRTFGFKALLRFISKALACDMEQLFYYLQLFLEKLYWIIKVNTAAGCNKARYVVCVCLFNCISFITFNLCRYLLRNNWADEIWLCLSCEYSRCRKSLLRHRTSARQTVYLYVTPHTEDCFGNICSANLIDNTCISVVPVCKGPATQDEIRSDSHPILSKLALFYNL